MSCLNNYSATGRLTKNWDVKHGSSGTAYASNTLAIDTSFGKDKSALFLPLKTFGKSAESLEKYTCKGSSLAIESRLQQENWEKKDGTKQSMVVAVVTRSVFLDSKKERTQGEGDIPEEEIPF